MTPDPEDEWKYWIYNAIMLILLVTVVYADYICFQFIKTVNKAKCYKCTFYIMRSGCELAKAYVCLTLFLDRNIFLDKINLPQRFTSELKWYISVNALVTIVLFFWLLKLTK